MPMPIRKFLVTGNFVVKATGVPSSSIVPISEGISKAGQPFQYADLDRREVIEGTYDVGTILQGTMNLTVAVNTDSVHGTRSVKLNKD